LFQTPSLDARVATLAARQHGLIRADQLRALGLDQRAISRLAAKGRFHRVYRGVYAVGHLALAREGSWLAAVLASGEGAALGRRSAVEHWAVGRRRVAHSEVIVPRKRREQRSIELVHSRTLAPPDIVVYKGIPVTHVARTLVDLTDVYTPYQLANVIHEAAFRKRFDLRATQRQLARANGRRNVGVLKRALELHRRGSAGTRSELEDRFLEYVQAMGLPEPLVNVRREDGIEPDFAWPDRRLIVEIDGPGHDRPRAKTVDARNERVLREAGYEVIRLGTQRTWTPEIARLITSRWISEVPSKIV
jgi:hypothetical protein